MADLSMAVVLTGEAEAKAAVASLAASTKALAEAAAGVTGTFRSASESASAFTSGIRSVAEAENALHVGVQNSIVALKAQKSAMADPAYKAAQKELESLKAEVDGIAKSGASGGVSMASLAAGFYMAQQGARVLSGAVMSVVDAAKQYDSVRARLTATEGSALVADKDLKNLQELAKLPGLGFGEASNAMAALRSLHVSAKDTFSLIEGIARGNASMGGGAEAFGRVMYQIQQSIGKSKVGMDDLRPVMEAIPNIGSMIQEKFGSIDSEKINKQLESMGKTSKDFWMDIAEMASKLPPAGDTIANNIDNIGDAWTRFKASLANTDVIKGATGALASFIDAVAKRNETATSDNAYKARAEQSLGKSSFLSQLMYGDNGGDKDLESEIARLKANDEARAYAIEAVNKKKDDDAQKAAEERRKRDEKKEKDDKEAKKRRTAEIAEAKREQAEILRTQEEADRAFSGATGISYGSYSVAHPGGVDADGPGRGPSLTKSMVKSDEKTEKDKEELRKKIAEKTKQIAAEEERVTKAHIHLNDLLRKSDEEAAKARIDAYEKIGSAGAQTFDTLAGVMAKAEGQQSASYKAMFDVAKAFAIGQAAVSMEVSIAKASEAGFPQNIALMAEAAAQGAIIIADVQAVAMGHAKGGTQMGGYAWRHESGPEMAHAIVPTQIMQASHTTNNTTNAPITIHIHGGDQKSILRTIRNATTNGAGVSH